MNSRSVSELVGMPTIRKSADLTHPGYQPAGSYNRLDMKIAEGLWLFVLGHVARHYVPSLAKGKPAGFGIVDGPPGEGKTEGVKATCSRAGVDVMVLSPSEFAAETENGGAVAVDRLKDVTLAITAREQRPILVCLDDFDLSNVARLASSQYTVNTQVTTGALQHLADSGELRTAQGVSVPIIMTGNDFTSLRGSLLRAGRAQFYHHTLSLEEKSDIVARIFGTNDAKGMRALVSAYRKEPISFFADLRTRAVEAELNSLIGAYGLKLDLIESAMRNRRWSIDIEDLRALAADAVARRAVNFLGRR